jgi:hypothetical protein
MAKEINIQKWLIGIGETIAGITILYLLINKFFDGVIEKQFNTLLHHAFPKTNHPGDKRTGNQTNPLTGGGFVAPPVTANQKRITLSDDDLSAIVDNIGATRHALSSNDYDAALTEIEKAQTKTDLAMIITMYDAANKQSILGTGIGEESLMTYLKGLSTDQKSDFDKWVKKLPDYV